MTKPELTEKFSRETKERLDYNNFDIYFSADRRPKEVQLEGAFTSEQLRLIADQLDRFNEELTKLAI